jgi:hypothetical protein
VSRPARLMMFITLTMSSFSMLSATAEAVTWDNRGNTAFTATNPSTGTLSSTGVNLVCHSATATGTAPNGTITGNTYSAPGAITFSPCFISGIPTSIDCGFTLTTSSTASPFHGNLDMTCTVTQFAMATCQISGQTTVDYHNPASASQPGRLTLSASTTLRIGNRGTNHCIYGTNDPFNLTVQTFTTTSANPPTLVRTA